MFLLIFNPVILTSPSKFLILSITFDSKPFNTDIEIIKAKEPTAKPIFDIIPVNLPTPSLEERNLVAIK